MANGGSYLRLTRKAKGFDIDENSLAKLDVSARAGSNIRIQIIYTELNNFKYSNLTLMIIFNKYNKVSVYGCMPYFPIQYNLFSKLRKLFEIFDFCLRRAKVLKISEFYVFKVFFFNVDSANCKKISSMFSVSMFFPSRENDFSSTNIY